MNRGKRKTNMLAVLTAPESIQHHDKGRLVSMVGEMRDSGMEVVTYTVSKDVLRHFGLENLPDGIAIIGGAARAIAQEVIFDEQAPVRDIDLIAVSQLCSEETLSDLGRLSEEYMASDNAYGHGVELYDSLPDYFASRDFTMNQMMVVDGVLLMTSAARDALRDKIIEPMPHECAGGYLGPKLTVKAILMQAVFKEWYGSSEMRGFDIVPWVRDFYIALGLNKAFQYGDAITGRFLDTIRQLDWIADEDVDDPIAFAKRLAEENEFNFRDSEVATLVNELWSDMPPAYDAAHERAIHLMGKFAAKLPAGVSASEYTNPETNDWLPNYNPSTGYRSYTSQSKDY